MSTIDKYYLKASPQFPVSGTEEITENFQLIASTVSEEGVISGTVTSGTVPIAGATVKVFDSSDNPVAHTITNPEGKYTISSIVRGSYKVTAAKDGYFTPLVIPVTVSANRPTTVDISLAVDPDAALNTLYGIIRAAGTLTPLENVNVNTYSVVGTTQTLVSTTHTNRSGQYVSPYLANGEYIIVANLNGYNQTTSGTTTLSDTEIASLDMTLVANATSNTATVSGIITDNSTLLPIGSAIVALYGITGATETLLKLTKSNSAGRYLFGSVASANYVVKAFAQKAE
ncbi:carboxypeptidase-like regulatory domain-containing protein [Papillibacter cinnamivorans]|uniref:Carboxypeptidase regulatory-like domain-containing protein n=1 Tax=Papillibacter cinnamivorans DSM 12816 TaxID=1122930 RepID=A0A1W1YEJ7_9FIRM|nr:carboxypeptidase-like regulatory domain-containing protein [Papillibacter cinnamivorans]SMC34566.1 Carboxypeptidase regulatory-like domain-containing protein [Papillibacter cinnamivorans DSM 12816]